MAASYHKEIQKAAREQKRRIRFYIGGGDIYCEGESRIEGPAFVTVKPYGKTEIERLSYRLVGV